MTHHDKLEAMYRHMASIGVSKWTAAPPVWRLLWRFGLKVPPPLFIPGISVALATGLCFGVLWSLFMWVVRWSRQEIPFLMIVSDALVAGAFVGIGLAVYFRYLARKHRLPRWSEYTGAPLSP